MIYNWLARQPTLHIDWPRAWRIKSNQIESFNFTAQQLGQRANEAN